MSGPGNGSSRSYSDFGGGSTSDECGSLVVHTTLNSPVATVVSSLVRGQMLAVAVETSAQGKKSLVAKDASGRTAGALTPPDLIKILTCIERGYEYVAEVLENPTGGAVPVRIRGK